MVLAFFWLQGPAGPASLYSQPVNHSAAWAGRIQSLVQGAKSNPGLWRQSAFGVLGMQSNTLGLAEDVGILLQSYDPQNVLGMDSPKAEARVLETLFGVETSLLSQQVMAGKGDWTAVSKLKAALNVVPGLDRTKRENLIADLKKAMEQAPGLSKEIEQKAQREVRALGSLPEDAGNIEAKPAPAVSAADSRAHARPSVPGTGKERFQRAVSLILNEHLGTVLGEKGGYPGHVGRYFHRKDPETGREFYFILYFPKGNPNSFSKYVEIREYLRGGEEVVLWQFSGYQDGKLIWRSHDRKDGAGEVVFADRMSPRDKAEAYSLLAGWVDSLLAVRGK